jgi:hypothetical protein
MGYCSGMNIQWNAPAILAVIGVGLAVGGIVKPAWPLVAVACLLIGIAVFLVAGK